MTHELDKLYEHIDDIEIAMMTTRRTDSHLQSRAMATQKRASGADLWFVTREGMAKLADIEHDPHILARNAIVEVPHRGQAGKVRVVASPIRLSATPAAYRHGIPAPGEHTEAVLAEYAGLDPAEIAAARAAGVV